MIKRTLLKVPLKQDSPQRKTLFRTQGKVQGKLCKTIVDFGSTENVVSTEMVDKLKLKRVPHVSPHKISWLNKNQNFMVDE